MRKSDELGYEVYSEEEVKDMRERIIVDSKGTEREVKTKAQTVISKPPHKHGITTFSEYIGQIKELQEFRSIENLWEEEVKIDIQTPYKWFGVRPLSDLHIGHSGVDYEALEEILAGLLQTDNLRTVLLGDLGDFFLPKGRHPEGMLGDVITPDHQVHVLKKFFTEYQDEILAVTNDPSHTDWVYQTAGIDVHEMLVRGLRIPLVSQGGSIKLNFGETEYDILPFHQISKFKSSFNLTHAHKRALELHRDADCVMAGHIHKGSFEKAYRGGHEVTLIQCGTLKVEDDWGKKMGFLGRPQTYYPIVLFNTQEKRMQVMDNLDDAEDLLKIKLPEK